MYDILSLSLYQSSVGNASAIILRASSLHVFEKFTVLFVRWFWAPFFLQVVHALGLVVVTSSRDELPVVNRHFRLFD